jgi:hypothetical protein
MSQSPFAPRKQPQKKNLTDRPGDYRTRRRRMRTAGSRKQSRATVLLYLPARRAKSRTDAPVSRCPPYKEVGEILGISESNVATKISRIKQQIKQAFKAEPDQ